MNHQNIHNVSNNESVNMDQKHKKSYSLYSGLSSNIDKAHIVQCIESKTFESLQ